MLHRLNPKRRGATTVEFAFIAPVLYLLIFGLVVLALGVFRYCETAYLAREAARYASVHGADYSRTTHNPAATQESIYQDVVLPRAHLLDPARLKCTVTWDKNNAPKYEDADGKLTTNIVTVTVTYDWVPERYLGGIKLGSTSRMPMAY